MFKVKIARSKSLELSAYFAFASYIPAQSHVNVPDRLRHLFTTELIFESDTNFRLSLVLKYCSEASSLKVCYKAKQAVQNERSPWNRKNRTAEGFLIEIPTLNLNNDKTGHFIL